MREVVLGVAIVAAAAVIACGFRYTPILAHAEAEGVLDRWTGGVTYPWPDECAPAGGGQATQL